MNPEPHQQQATNVPPPPDLTSERPGYQICYDYWVSLKGNRHLPSWRDWQWSALPPDIIPYFMVVDVHRDPMDYVFRFWGTAFVENQRPMLFSYPIQVGAGQAPYDRASLRLPLSDDGETVHQIATFADWRDELKNVRRDLTALFGERDF